MIRYNILGKGFLDMEDTGGPSFKAENQQFRFADISLGRSVEFTVPATNRNKALLGFADDPAEYGEDMRRRYFAQMTYDGGGVFGMFAVTGFASEAFSCVFYMEAAEWVDDLQGKKLSDCVCNFSPVRWIAEGDLVDADDADPSQGVQVVKYETTLPAWRLPSVNVHAYIDDILTNLGITHDIAALSTDYWMTAASIKGGGDDAVTLYQQTPSSATVTETTADYFFTVVEVRLDSFKNYNFGSLFPEYHYTKAFKASRDLAVTFPSNFPNGVYFVKWNGKSSSSEVLGGVNSAGSSGKHLGGRTVNLSKGDIVFFADKPFERQGGEEYYGWRIYSLMFTVTLDVSSTYDMNGNELWRIQLNAPDMTVFEFLQSVAVATGLELHVDAVGGISLKACSYGQKDDFKALKDVVSVEEVTRCVDAWGEGSCKAVVKFDSEDYVTDHLEASYDIDNDQFDEEKEAVAKFSEGNVGNYGVVIEDGEYSDGYQLKATKWTLTRVDLTALHPDYLQRVELPTIVGYDDIAMQSTCLKVKVAAQEADFFGLQPSTTFLWRGVAYVWTDADWGDGIMSLTLQKVSQPVADELPYDAEVEWLRGNGGFINTGIVPDDDTGIKVAFERINSDGWVCGVWDRNVSRAVTIGANYSSVSAYWDVRVQSPTTPMAKGVAELNFDYYRRFVVTPDGGSSVETALGSISTQFTQPMGIFGCYYEDGTHLAWTDKISAFQVTQGHDLVLDLIPVRVGSVGYMYDRVSGTLFGNVGSGDFVVGPDV